MTANPFQPHDGRRMGTRSRHLVAAALRMAHSAGMHRVLRESSAGRGVILMLHRVCPGAEAACVVAGNRDLMVTPEFLAELIGRVRGLGYDIVPMDEAMERLARGSGRRFAVFTVDDAYRDAIEHGYRVFRNAQAPFTVYVPTAWPDGGGIVRWAILEALLSSGGQLEPGIDGALPPLLATTTRRQRVFAHDCLDRYLNSLGAAAQNQALRTIAERHDIDVAEICRRYVAGWDDIRAIATDPLVTIGAHSIDHLVLSRTPRGELVRQLADSRAAVERELGKPCLHFAYPFGGADAAGEREFAHAAAAGYATAVTTRRGVVVDHHRVRPTALPRIAISGTMQDLRCVEMLISGVPDRFLNGFRKKVA